MKEIEVKIYPNQEQTQQIEQNFGNTRFVWNQMLDMWNTRYQNNPNLSPLTKSDLTNLLPALKREYPFLKESEETSLEVECEALHDSFEEFFRGQAKNLRLSRKRKQCLLSLSKIRKNIVLQKMR